VTSCENCVHFKVCYYRQHVSFYLPPTTEKQREAALQAIYQILASICRNHKPETLPDGGGLEEFEAVGRFYWNLVCPYCGYRFNIFKTGALSSPIICPKCLREFPPPTETDGGGLRCARCGNTKDLVVHHRDGFHGLFFPNDIVILCRKCHGEIHGKARCGKLDEVKEYFCYDKVSAKIKETLPDGGGLHPYNQDGSDSEFTFTFFIRRNEFGELEVLEEEDAFIEHGISFFEEEKYSDYVEIRVPASNWREAKEKLKQYLPLIVKKIEGG